MPLIAPKKTTCPECGKKVMVVMDTNYDIVSHEEDCSLSGALLTKKPKEVELVDDGFRQPYRYQQKGIEFANKRSAFALFWEMRLGKTLTSIKSFKQRGCKKVIVICPKSVLNNWLRELELEGINPVQINCKLLKAKVAKHMIKTMPGWYVVNYDVLIREDLSDFGWDGMILDESDRIKDPSTKISRHLAGCQVQKQVKVEVEGEIKELQRFVTVDSWKKVKNKCILTGTPAPENLLNYFQQLKFLSSDGDFAGCDNYYQFKNKYFFQSAANVYLPYPRMKNFLASALANTCSILKRDQVGIGSKKIYEDRTVQLTKEYQEEYKIFAALWATKELEVSTSSALAAFTRLHQLSGGYLKDLEETRSLVSDHKLNEVSNILKNDLKGERVVIWFKYLNEMKHVIEALPKDSYEIWNGNTSLENRKRIEEDFAYRNRHKSVSGKTTKPYLLCQTRSAFQGLDFAACDQAIYFSNEFGSKYRVQSEDRIVHPEKEVPLLYLDILAENTICPLILQRLKAKEENQQQFLAKIHQATRNELGI